MIERDDKLSARSRITDTVTDPTSVIYRDCDVRGSILGKLVSIGDDCLILNSHFESNIQINRRNLIQDTHMGRFSYTGQNTTIRGVNVGRFCSISWNVSIGGKDHDIERATNSTLWAFHNLDGNKQTKKFDYRQGVSGCIVGNDVWVSSNSVILRGVNVGHGAVIGAGAVVTKDVEPYSVVAGVPAKPIKKRFDDNIIAALLDLAWWDWPVDVIRANTDLIYKEKVDLDVIARLQVIKDGLVQ